MIDLKQPMDLILFMLGVCGGVVWMIALLAVVTRLRATDWDKESK